MERHKVKSLLPIFVTGEYNWKQIYLDCITCVVYDGHELCPTCLTYPPLSSARRHGREQEMGEATLHSIVHLWIIAEDSQLFLFGFQWLRLISILRHQQMAAQKDMYVAQPNTDPQQLSWIPRSRFRLLGQSAVPFELELFRANSVSRLR